MTQETILKRISILELELKILRHQIKETKILKKEKQGKRFSDLYGIWKEFGNFSYEEIKEAEIRLSDKL